MAVYEVFRHPELRRYKTHLCSKASLLMLIVLFLTFIPPLFVVYRSYGFWLKEAYYREYPDVDFKKELLLVLELEGETNYITYSTFPKYNQLRQQFLRLPLIKSRDEDRNGDGYPDSLLLDIEVPVRDTEKIMGVKLLLFFEYRLYKYSTFIMECMAYLNHESSKPGGKYEVLGDLRIRQKEPLSYKGLDLRYNQSIIDTSSVYAETYNLINIFKSYSGRNVTTVLADQYSVWSSGRGAGQPFTISATVSYPQDVYLYTPGFWYLIKWGWIQYVSVLLIFLFAFDRIKIFIFQNQLVTTIVEKDKAA
ncbi:hypothetical protein ScPMuIL_000684 [Solemya velum]